MEKTMTLWKGLNEILEENSDLRTPLTYEQVSNNEIGPNNSDIRIGEALQGYKEFLSKVHS